MAPVAVEHLLLHGHRGGDGAARRGEDDHQPVADVLHLPPADLGDGRPQLGEVGAPHRLRTLFADPSDQARRVHEVGKQNRHSFRTHRLSTLRLNPHDGSENLRESVRRGRRDDASVDGVRVSIGGSGRCGSTRRAPPRRRPARRARGGRRRPGEGGDEGARRRPRHGAGRPAATGSSSRAAPGEAGRRHRPPPTPSSTTPSASPTGARRHRRLVRDPGYRPPDQARPPGDRQDPARAELRRGRRPAARPRRGGWGRGPGSG